MAKHVYNKKYWNLKTILLSVIFTSLWSLISSFSTQSITKHFCLKRGPKKWREEEKFSRDFKIDTPLCFIDAINFQELFPRAFWHHFDITLVYSVSDNNSYFSSSKKLSDKSRQNIDSFPVLKLKSHNQK